jgi:hypothetical protein
MKSQCVTPISPAQLESLPHQGSSIRPLGANHVPLPCVPSFFTLFLGDEVDQSEFGDLVPRVWTRTRPWCDSYETTATIGPQVSVTTCQNPDMLRKARANRIVVHGLLSQGPG